MRDSIRVDLRGTPAVAVATEPFKGLGRSMAKSMGLESFPIVSIPHPQAGVPREIVYQRLNDVLDQVINGLTRAREVAGRAEKRKVIVKPEPEVLTVIGRSNTEALRAVNDLFYGRRWTDGFPIVPPTPEAVEWMLSGTDRDPDEVVGLVAPGDGIATVRNIAINSVMAGAEPGYLPVIIAAVEAIVDPRFAVGEQKWGVHGLQTTTGPLSPLIVVNGPIGRELKMESGFGCFSRGNRPNATIGRAVRLILTNAGKAYPGINDMKAQGSAQEFTFCCAEREEHRVFNEGKSPWPTMHEERGFPRGSNTVTVAAAWTPINIQDSDNCGPKILDRIVAAMSNLGVVPYTTDRDCFIVLGATHAGCLADAGMSKSDIQEYLYANAVMPWGLYKQQYPGTVGLQPKWMKSISDDSTTVHVHEKPQNFQIVVAGGDCPYSQIVRVSYKSVTTEISRPK